MRNFTVLLLLLVLFYSVFLLITKPLHQNKIPEKREKTHVEKLLTESSKIPQDTEVFGTENQELDLPAEEYSKKSEFSKSEEKQNETEIPVHHEDSADNKNKNENYVSIPQNTKQNNAYKSVTQELYEKYGNNPNAEVSQEDLQKYMIKMIDAIQKQQ